MGGSVARWLGGWVVGRLGGWGSGRCSHLLRVPGRPLSHDGSGGALVLSAGGSGARRLCSDGIAHELGPPHPPVQSGLPRQEGHRCLFRKAQPPLRCREDAGLAALPPSGTRHHRPRYLRNRHQRAGLFQRALRDPRFVSDAGGTRTGGHPAPDGKNFRRYRALLS